MRYLITISLLLTLISCGNDRIAHKLPVRDQRFPTMRFPDESTGRQIGTMTKKVKDQYLFLRPKSAIPSDLKLHYDDFLKMMIPGIDREVICRHFDLQGHLLVCRYKRFMGGMVFYTYDSLRLLSSSDEYTDGGLQALIYTYTVSNDTNVLNCLVMKKRDMLKKDTIFYANKQLLFDDSGKLVSIFITRTNRVSAGYIKYEYQGDKLLSVSDYEFLKKGSKNLTSKESYDHIIQTNYYYTADHLDSTIQHDNQIKEDIKTYYNKNGYPYKTVGGMSPGIYRYTYYE